VHEYVYENVFEHEHEYEYEHATAKDPHQIPTFPPSSVVVCPVAYRTH
jgi:hypothetical protein